MNFAQGRAPCSTCAYHFLLGTSPTTVRKARSCVLQRPVSTGFNPRNLSFISHTLLLWELARSQVLNLVTDGALKKGEFPIPIVVRDRAQIGTCMWRKVWSRRGEREMERNRVTQRNYSMVLFAKASLLRFDVKLVVSERSTTTTYKNLPLIPMTLKKCSRLASTLCKWVSW